MKLIKYFLIIFFIINFYSLSTADNNSVNEITKNLRCLVCQGQSVHDSDSEFANSLKILIKKKLQEGKNEKQINNYLIEKYGEWISYDPKFKKNTYFLWLLPILMFILGGVIIFKLFIINKN